MAEPDRSGYTAADTWYVVHPGNQSTGTLPTLDTLTLWPIEVPARMRIDTARIDVTSAATAGGIVRGGIYGSRAGGLPDFGRLLVNFGSFDVTATGLRDATFAAASIPRGRVYLALVNQVASAGTRVVSTWVPNTMLAVGAAAFSGVAASCYVRTGVSGTLPTSGDVTGMSATNPPRTFFHTAT